jgi:hypothetical protein
LTLGREMPRQGEFLMIRVDLIITSFVIFTLVLIGRSSEASAAKPKNICEKSFEKDLAGVSKRLSEKKDPKRWEKYGSFIKKYSGCLDANYSKSLQATSEAALAHDWDGFSKYVSKKKNRNETVLKEIKKGFNPDSTSKDIEVIQDSARDKCPPSMKDYCLEVTRSKLN